MKSLNRIEKEDDKIHFQLNKRERSCTSTIYVSVNKKKAKLKKLA